MTGQGSSLPEVVLDRIAEKKREALEAEFQALEGQIDSGLERHLSEFRAYVDGQIEGRKKESAAASEKELKEIHSFGEETLRRLEAELQRRRSERLKDEKQRREERILKEKEEEEAKKRQAEEEARKKRAAAEDPATKVRTILKQAQGHMDAGDIDLAVKLIAEGLEIDGFNTELLDLDAKIREAIASDTFAAPATPAPAPETKEEKEKGKPAKQKEPKAKPPRQPTPLHTPGTPDRRKFPAWAFTAIAAVLILGAAVIAYFAYMPKAPERSVTLVVLPWTAASDDREMKVFTDALPEVVVRLLSTTQSDVGLLGYATSSNLAATGSDPVSMLGRLGYSHFLRGELTRKDSLFSVHVELSDSGGETFWSKDYQTDMTGLVLIPHDIAPRLRAYFGDATATGGTAVQIRNIEAYVLYLRGLNAMRTPDRRGLDQAINAFNRSL
ncbi:MAG TPA: hypothetical protein VI932_07965, partial [Bacteroidota bacterium]|nr:hypothetical protein [Bacteroidota bacterium]